MLFTLPGAFATSGGKVIIGGGSMGLAPNDATYVTLTTNATLLNERVLTAGTGIALTDGGAGSTITVDCDATLNEILSSGNTSGGVDLEITAGDSFILGENAATPWTPAAAKGCIWVKNDAPNTVWFTDDAGTDFNLATGGETFAQTLAIGNTSGGTDVEVSAGDALLLVENAAVPWTPAATKGALWVKNDTPCTLYFTDDAGTDFQLGAGLPGDVVGPAGATDDNIATFDGATGKLIQDGGEKITDLLDLGGTRAMSGDLDMGTNAVTNVGNVDGRDVSADGSTLDTHVGSSANPHTVTLTQALTGGSTTSGVDLEVTAGDSFILGENAATPWTPAAAKGAIWVKNDTPNTLYFTDDAGTDFQLGAGGASSIEKAFVASSHTGNNTAKSYLPFRGLTEHTSITTEGLSWIAPHDGEVKTVMVWPWSDCGSTVVGFHKNGNTTATETDTQSAGSQTATTFSFSSSSFSKGDRIHISFDPTNASGVTHVTLSLELDTST